MVQRFDLGRASLAAGSSSTADILLHFQQAQGVWSKIHDLSLSRRGYDVIELARRGATPAIGLELSDQAVRPWFAEQSKLCSDI